MTTNPFSLANLRDHELLATVRRLAGDARRATASLIAALAEIARRLYLGQGCSSLFTNCTQVLHLSAHAAYARIRCRPQNAHEADLFFGGRTPAVVRECPSLYGGRVLGPDRGRVRDHTTSAGAGSTPSSAFLPVAGRRFPGWRRAPVDCVKGDRRARPCGNASA